MSKLQVKETQAADVTILDLTGNITIGDGNIALRGEIRRLLEEGKKRILLDLGNVRNVDSSGLGELVASFATISRSGGQLKMVHLTRRIQDLMAITKLLTVFDTYESRSEALGSFE